MPLNFFCKGGVLFSTQCFGSRSMDLALFYWIQIQICFCIWIWIQVMSDVFIEFLAQFWVIYFFEVLTSIKWSKSYAFLHWIKIFGPKIVFFANLDNFTLIFRDGVNKKLTLWQKYLILKAYNFWTTGWIFKLRISSPIHLIWIQIYILKSGCYFWTKSTFKKNTIAWIFYLREALKKWFFYTWGWPPKIFGNSVKKF